MRYRIAFGSVLLMALILGIVSVAFALPPENTVLIKTVDVSTESQLTVSGSFSVKMGDTLEEVTVWAYPESGGVMAIQTATKTIDGTKMEWGPVTLKKQVYKGKYVVRADGKFTVGGIYSSKYASATAAGGDPPAPGLVLTWNKDSPTSEKEKQITCAGTYTGTPDAGLGGAFVASPELGGKPDVGFMTLSGDANKTWTTTVPITVTTGNTKYGVIGAAKGSDGLFYCPPLAYVTAK